MKLRPGYDCPVSTSELVDGARALLSAITPGTWTAADVGGRVYVPESSDEAVPTLIADSVFRNEDKAFISSAPRLVEALCREIERLRRRA